MKYHVEKSIIINTDINRVRPFVEDFNQWSVWSPWTIADPECDIEISGKPGEVGHAMKWDGELVGSGTNELIKKDENILQYDLNFIKPFKSKAKTSFLFEKDGGGTKVTWTMDSGMPFFLFFMVKIMKNWIGMDYNRGLKMLKELVEKGSINAKTSNNGLVDLKGFSYVGIKRTVSFDKVGEEMRKDFGKLIEDIVYKHGKSAKHWLTLYPKTDMRNMMMTYIAATSSEELDGINLGPEYVTGEIQDGKALEIKHEGSYEFLGNAWALGTMYVRTKKLKQRDVQFEQYWNSPKEVKPHELKTSVYFPVKS